MTGARDGNGSFAGRTLGNRYRVTALVGTGAMAEVYRATDLRLGRQVAVKVLRPQYAADDDYVRRFRQEARLAAAVSHPNLVNAYDTDAGEDATPTTGRGSGGGGPPRPYIVLELVEGETLADRLRHGPLALDEAVDIARQVAAGVGFAHRRNLVHRDLKPANVILTDEGDAKVADFGLAQDMRASAVTQAGTVWGTVEYLAPERAQGEPATVASDIYALGVIVYEMLVGSPPFIGGTAASVMNRQVNEAPRALGDVQPAYRGDVDRTVMRALAKGPGARYESMEAFAGALERVVGGTTRAAPPVPGAGKDARTRVIPALRSAPAPARVDRGAAATAGARPERRPEAANHARPMATRTRTAIAGGILGFFALMGVGAWLVRSFELPLLADSPLPMPTVARVATAPATVPVPATPAATATPAIVLVPVVTGDTAARARDTLAAVGLVAEVTDDWSREVPAGTVALQDPVAGATVGRGRAVRLVVSKGPQRVVVPNTIGKSVQNARDELTRAGLRTDVVEEATSLTVPGVVFEQVPRGGEIDPSQAITIKVSRGPARPMVPGVIGMRADDARRILEQEGFRAALRYEANSGVDPDVAFAQLPVAGTTADRGSTVDVRVRRDGPSPADGSVARSPTPGVPATAGAAQSRSPGTGTPRPAGATMVGATATRTPVPGASRGEIVLVSPATAAAIQTQASGSATAGAGRRPQAAPGANPAATAPSPSPPITIIGTPSPRPGA